MSSKLGTLGFVRRLRRRRLVGLEERDVLGIGRRARLVVRRGVVVASGLARADLDVEGPRRCPRHRWTGSHPRSDQRPASCPPSSSSLATGESTSSAAATTTERGGTGGDDRGLIVVLLIVERCDGGQHRPRCREVQGRSRVDHRQGGRVVVHDGHGPAAAVVGPGCDMRVRRDRERGDDDPHPVVAAPGVPCDVGRLHALVVEPLRDEFAQFDVPARASDLCRLRLLGHPRTLGQRPGPRSA